MLDKLKLWWLRNVTLANPDKWLIEVFGGGTDAKSGARVTADTAVQVTAVFACIRLYAQVLASLPLHTYERIDGGKNKSYDHPLYSVLHDAWNPMCTSYQGRLLSMVNLLLTGSAYAEIVRDNNGNVLELWPIPSNKVGIRRNSHTKEHYYEVYTDSDKPKILYPLQILHIPWIGVENLHSYEPVKLAREAIGLSISVEEFGSRFFSNGANASGIAEYPGKLDDKSYERFTKSFTQKYTGLDKAQRVMFLEQGLKFHKLTIDPNEAQALETRIHQVEEVARFYNVPLHLIQLHEKNTSWGTGIEEMNIGFVTFNLRPYLVCWEQEMLRQLFLPHGQRRDFAEHNIDGLLRGDAKSRAEAFDIMRRNGIINADEWRSMENMNPQPDGLGQIYYVPLNWVKAGEEQPAPQAERKRSNTGNAAAKLKAAQNYQKVFEDTALRIVRREKAQITDKMKNPSRNSEDFLAWLEDYYRDAPEWMRQYMLPTLTSYGKSVADLAAEETGKPLSIDIDETMREYADIWARDYSQYSKAQIEHVVNTANKEGGNPAEAVEERLQEWEEKRPGKVAQKETIECSGVISRSVYLSAGVQRMKWVAAGSDPCDFCMQLDGRVVGIDRPFVQKGDIISSESGTMPISSNTLNPQLHGGCDCMITIG